MPQLTKEQASSVAQQDYTTAEDYVDYTQPVPPGKYVLRLLNVEDTDPQGKPYAGPSGKYWRWILEHVEGEWFKKRQYINTSLSKKAEWKMKEVFMAFGATPDTDTETLRGMLCEGIISVRLIQKGARKGERSNNVDRLNPLPEELEEEFVDLPEMTYVAPSWDDGDDADEEPDDVPF